MPPLVAEGILHSVHTAEVEGGAEALEIVRRESEKADDVAIVEDSQRLRLGQAAPRVLAIEWVAFATSYEQST